MGMKAYLDASGSDGKSRFLAVCGYVADEQEWDAFRADWLAMLDGEGVHVFHMTDLMSLQREFSRKNGWNEKRRDRFLGQACKIITERTKFGVSGVINIADCEAYFPLQKSGLPKVKNRKKYSKEYAIATLSCIDGISRLARRHGHCDHIQYVFESGDGGYSEVEEAFRISCGDEEQREHYLIKGWETKHKADAPELQSADMLAHQIRSAFLRGGSLERIDLERNVIPGLIRSQDKWIYFYDKENLPIMKSLDDLVEEIGAA